MKGRSIWSVAASEDESFVVSQISFVLSLSKKGCKLHNDMWVRKIEENG